MARQIGLRWGWVMAVALVALVGCGGGGGGTSSPPTSTTPPAPTPISAGIFVQPATFVPATQSALALTAQARFASTAAQDTSTTIPAFSGATAVLTIPNVSVNGTMYGQALLHHDGNGVFSLTNSPTTNVSISQTASKYTDGNLTLASVMVDGHRYTNAKLHLEVDGKFKLVSINDPIAVQKTSNLNAKNLNIPSQKFPTTLPRTDTYGDRIAGGVAFGDFFQTGEIAMVGFTNREVFFSTDRSTTPGVAIFFKMVNGEWAAQPQMLDVNTGCISPRRVLVADFNNDGIPDVFASCHGSEAGPLASWPGEQPRILLSQIDGTYKNIAAPITCYCHGSSAGDVDGDGNIDIIVSDFNRARDGKSGLVLLKGDGKGGFRVVEGTGFIPATADYLTFDRVYYKAYFDVELIDFNNDGKLDVFLGTGETENSYILAGTGHGDFPTVLKTFPIATTEYHFNDAIFSGGYLYIYTNLNTDNYKSQIRKYDLNGNGYTVIFDGATQYPAWNTGNYDFIFIMPFNGMLVPYDARFGAAIKM